MRTKRNQICRMFALVLVSILLFAGMVLPTRSQSTEGDRPNIVFILIDDLAYKAMGFTGRYPFLDTPNIDRLAEEGAQMTNAFVTTSLCSPSRASFLTGMYAHRHNVRTNQGEELASDIPTFPERLQKNGYKTAFVGKWHMGPTSDPRPGFDYWLSFRGQGNYYQPRLNENGRIFNPDGYMTDLLTEHATDWLNKQENSKKPFMLYLSHKAVHGPFKPAPRHRNALDGERAPKPENFEDDYADKPRWMRRAHRYGARSEGWKKSEGKQVPDRINPGNWHGGNMDYFESLLSVDDSVGRVMRTLDAQNQLDETLIVFTSDNGFFLGRHHRGDKRLAYESSIRIPMLVRYPELVKAGSTVDEMVLNIDVAPTFLDVAGVSSGKQMQGKSFLPLLKGKQVSNWRDAFLYEYFQEGWLPAIPTLLAVRTSTWKYITFPERPDQVDELYDLQNDPYELNNLAEDPAYSDRLTEMQSRLKQLKDQTDYVSRRQGLIRELKQVKTTLALHYGPEGKANGKILDATGRGQHAIWNRATYKESPHGPAMTFEGDSAARFNPEHGTFSPAKKPVTVGAWVRPEQKTGVVYAHGGKTHGMSLYMENRIPHFAVRLGGGFHQVRGNQPLSMNEWTQLTGQITKQARLRLLVNGTAVATTDLSSVILTQPNDGVSVGADTGSRVTKHESPLRWSGRIADLRVYRGQPDEKTIRKWSTP